MENYFKQDIQGTVHMHFCLRCLDTLEWGQQAVLLRGHRLFREHWKHLNKDMRTPFLLPLNLMYYYYYCYYYYYYATSLELADLSPKCRNNNRKSLKSPTR